MGKRLEITLFGVEYTVGIVRLNHGMIKTGMKIYGPRKWTGLVNTIALDPKAKKKANEISHTIGHPFKIVYRQTGMILQGRTFGMETFWGGNFFPIDTVESRNRTLQPSVLMQGCKSMEMLGVFWACRDNAMFFRWEDVDDPSQEGFVLSYDSLAPVLVRNRAFDIVTDVTYQGRSGRRKGIESENEFVSQKHIFHKKN